MSELETVIKKLKKRNVFLTGGAGVGKSYLVKRIIEYYRKNEKSVIALGSTGIAAVNVGGYTIHSFFLFGISSNFEELKSYDKRNRKRLKELYHILQKCDLLIIDEVSMISADLLDLIHFRLREAGFRGKILLVGDFFQLPPVVKSKDRSTSLFSFLYAFESSAWKSFDPLIIELLAPKRTRDYDFVKILRKVRVGECDRGVIKYLKSLLKGKEAYCKDSTVLFGTNREANEYNEENLKKLPTSLKILKAEIKTEEDIPQNIIDKWIKNLPVERELKLKVDSKVIFTSNKKDYFYNGEQAEVVSIDSDEIIVKKIDGSFVRVEPHEYKLTKVKYDEKEDILNEDVLAYFYQYPLKSAYGITIHKSQGMSIEKLVCNVDNIFEKSQFYVALSRATNPKTLSIIYSRGDFEKYVKRIIKVSEKVKEFYDNSKILKIKEYVRESLFKDLE